MKRSFILVFSILLVIIYALSCAPKPPIPIIIENSRKINAGFDEVWEAVIGHFAKNMYTISTIEKDSGIIVSDDLKIMKGTFSKGRIGSQEPGFPDICDCGKPAFPFENVYGKFNVFVRKIDDETTSIQVNIKYWTLYYNAFTEKYDKWDCISTGALENLLIDDITKNYLQQ